MAVYKDPWNIVGRLAIILLSYIALSVIPGALVTAFMAASGFFAYDFVEQVVAERIFFWWTAAALLIGSVSTFTWLILWVGRGYQIGGMPEAGSASDAKEGTTQQSTTASTPHRERAAKGTTLSDLLLGSASLLISLAFLLAGIVANDSGVRAAIVTTWVLLGVLALHLGFLLFRPPRQQVATYGLLIATIVAATILFPVFSKSILGATLRRFGVGGGQILVTVRPDSPHSNPRRCGVLLLRTPTNVYVRDLAADSAVALVPLRENEVVEVRTSQGNTKDVNAALADLATRLACP
jgi:hypothetical protein